MKESKMYIDKLRTYDWQETGEMIARQGQAEVEAALNSPRRGISELAALLSPAALPYLEEMAQESRRLTQKRFGKTMQLYIPLYLSNYCENSCIYCGFNAQAGLRRKVLSEEEIMREVEAIKSYGYRHILLVTGESERKAGFDYLKRAVELVRPHFSLISIEVQPLSTDEYEQLNELGLNTVYVYQETYNKNRYPVYHPAGKKSDFAYRLDTPERLGKAGVRRMGLGFLIGLEDWRTEAIYMARHLRYLEQAYWRARYSISFPRLRPHEGHMAPNVQMSERELVQMICAFRLFDHEVEMSLSVRENARFRDHAVQLGITSMSAGSRTEPGGYTMKGRALEQFETDDNRSPAEIARMIKGQGYEAVWKDWDPIMQ